MKINFLVPEIVRSGGIRIIFEFANRLSLRGHDVVVYTPVIPFNPYKPRVKYHFLKHQLKYFLKQITGKPNMPQNIFSRTFPVKVLNGVSNFTVRDAEVMIATSWTTSHHVAALSLKKGKKFYFIQDYEAWNSNITLVDKSYTLPLNRIVIAKHLQHFLKEKFGEDSTVIRYGLNFNLFKNENKDFLRKPKTILILDHMLPNKNTAAAIKTVTKVKELYPEIKIKAFGIEQHHEMPGFIEFIRNPNDEMIKKLYCDSDIYLYPTLFEGCPATPLEAMACKCAVVANASAEIPYYIKDRDNGILAAPDKPEELLEGIIYLLNNNDEQKRISENGSKSIREEFDWDKNVTQLEQLFQQ